MRQKRRSDIWYISFPKKRSGVLGSCFEIADSFISAALIIFLIFLLAFRLIGVSGDSMKPTLYDKDWVAVTSAPRAFHRGDIVVVTQPWERNNAIIKRVIGVEGDTVDIDFTNGIVYVNGEKQTESYINEETHLSYDVRFPLTVPEGKVFVMGDNRNDSLDSRSSRVGFIDKNYILGKAAFRVYPAPKSLSGGK